MRQVLTPDYPLGCKRILVSDDYYQALEAGGIEIVTSPIQGIGSAGVITEDGVERPVDVIIYGTGFKATEFLAPLDIRGRDGQRLDRLLARRRLGPSRGRRAGLPQPVHAVWAQYQPRPQLHYLHGRSPGAVRGALYRQDAGPRYPPAGCQPGGCRPLQPKAPG